MEDAIRMRRALELAERGRGFVEPNPLVGAVVVHAGKIVGEGWHQRFGQAHAEVHALAAAKESARGATLFVTLEPCCHFGKTPPCTDAIIKAAVSRVVAAMTDPFPQVAGRGADVLRAAGIAVEIGLLEAESRRLNAPYLKLLATGRPYVHAKWAMSLDGKIATRTGDSKWISNDASRRYVHELRGRVDGIIVGIRTVLADDPLLTARPPGPRTAVRIILDSHGRLPDQSRLVQTAREVPVLITASEAVPAKRKLELARLGCEIVTSPAEANRPSLGHLLDELGRRRMTNVLVEGGGEVLGSFFDGGFIDEVHAFLSPRLIGGRGASSPLAGLGIENIRGGPTIADWQVVEMEGDVLLRGRFKSGPITSSVGA